VKRVPLVVWFAGFVALATAVATPAVRAYAVHEQSVPGSPLSVGRQRLYGWVDVLGVRFLPDHILPKDNVAMFGAFGRPDLSPGGLSLRVAGRSAADGFYFVGGTEPARTYRVRIEGEPVRGNAIAQFRCQSDADLDRRQAAAKNLLDDSSEPKRLIWAGVAAVERHVAGPSGADEALRIALTTDRGYTYQTTNTMTTPGDDDITEFSFRARVVSGGPAVQVVVNRAGGYDSRPVVEMLTPDWRRYSILHTSAWTGATQAQVAFNRYDRDVTIEIAAPRLTVRRARIDTPAPWLLQGWTPAGAPDPFAGTGVALDARPMSVTVSGARQVALLLSGASPYEYRIDAVKIEPTGGAPAAADSPCSISRTP